MILGAESVSDINRILQENAAVFGFQRMVVARDSELDDGANRRAPHGWKLDYEIMGAEFDEDPYVLRICCVSGLPRSACPDGAERVARILGPAVEQWLVKTRVEAPALPRVEAPTQPEASPSISGGLRSEVLAIV
jgi:hypothetical protein